MATQFPRLVNKQFNSPIGLYSSQNVQEVLERETQILANGAVGINFHNPDVGKPANLKNSAVLRMLEEEENRQRNGIGPGNDQLARPLRENISWPPPEYEQKNSLRSTFKDVVIPGAKRVAWPPPNETGSESPYVEQNAVSAKGGPQFPPSPGLQQNNYQAPAPQQPVSSNPPSHRPLRPLDISTAGSSPLSSPLLNQSPQGFRPSSAGKGWAPVHSPVATPTQPSWQQPAPQQQHSVSPHYQPAAQNQQSTSPHYQPVSQNQQSTSPHYQPVSQNQQSTSPRYQSVPQYQRSTSTQSTQSTHYESAHQSVSQQTYLGQQYQPTSPGAYQASQQLYQAASQQYKPVQQQYQPPQQQNQSPQQYPASQQQYQPPQQQNQAPQQQYQSPQQYQPPQQQYQLSQQQNQAPKQYQPPQQQYQSPQQYQPPQQQYQPPQQQYQPPQQQYQPPQQQYQPPQQQYQSPQQAPQSYQAAPKPATAPSQVSPSVQAAPAPVASRPHELPPSTITLRPKAPVSQAPPPVITSQPATATLKGGKHLRGDLKWPPENVKIQVAEENRLLLELAQGPACRPRRPNKDYTEFFEQHALNSTYPGYKIPPGTQFYRPE